MRFGKDSWSKPSLKLVNIALLLVAAINLAAINLKDACAENGANTESADKGSTIQSADNGAATEHTGKGVEPACMAEVESVLNKQCDAWNKGDLDGFMTGYLQSEDTSYTSGGTEVWGYKALHDRYQKKYGQSKETMGKLKFSNLKTFALGAKSALVIGHWHLDPTAPPAIDGVFSLVFVKTKEGWKVMHDHTSVDKKTP